MPFDQHIDPEKMSLSELVDAVHSMVENSKGGEMADMVGLTELMQTNKYKKFIQNIENVIKKDGNIKKLNAEVMHAVKIGLIFGIAVTIKLNTKGKDLRHAAEKDALEGVAMKQIRDFLFIFASLEKGAKDWGDSEWYENLIKNAVIDEPKKNENTRDITKHAAKKKTAS